VVLVAIDDDQLETTKRQLKAEFPNQQFRSVGVSLLENIAASLFLFIILSGGSLGRPSGLHEEDSGSNTRHCCSDCFQ